MIPSVSARIAVFLFILLSLQVSLGVESNALKKGAVIYGVVPPLFGSEPFSDVTRKLDHLDKIGVDVLWVAPVFATDDPSSISYSVTDYFSLRSDYGSEEDFRRLITEAHARGIKVIIDIVPNHSSSGHPMFEEALTRGKQSPFYEYYEWNPDGSHQYYFDWEHLPNLNFAHGEVVDLIERAFIHWVKEFDIDGYRVDVAWGVRERAPAFWPRLRKKLDALKPGLILLAEASVRDPYYLSHGFDLAYDWTEELGVWAWHDVFQKKEGLGQRLHQALLKSKPFGDGIARFLNNNDTGERFITRYGPKFTQVAATLQFTLPGVAILYTGDEIGAQYDPYADPPPLAWDDPFGLVAHYTKLATLREKIPALHSGDWEPLEMDLKGASYGFLRRSPEGSSVMVLLNFGDEAKVSVKATPALNSLGTCLRDVFTQKTYKFSKTSEVYEISLKKESSLLFEPCSKIVLEQEDRTTS